MKISLNNEFKVNNKVDEVMTKKYGNEYMTPEEARSKLHEFVNKLERKYGKR